jgi:transposase
MEKKKNKKHGLSEKLRVIKDYQSGYGSTTISRKRKIAESMVMKWIRVYQAHGIKGLEKQPRINISAEIKQQAVREILEKFLSFETVALKYRVSISAIYSWSQRVKEHGYASLLTIQQGRPTKFMGRPKKKQPETELEKLQEELRYLRAENALLKKLKALEEERIVPESARQSKPSKR